MSTTSARQPSAGGQLAAAIRALARIPGIAGAGALLAALMLAVLAAPPAYANTLGDARVAPASSTDGSGESDDSCGTANPCGAIGSAGLPRPVGGTSNMAANRPVLDDGTPAKAAGLPATTPTPQAKPAPPPAKSTTPKNTTNRPVLDDGTPVNAADLPATKPTPQAKPAPPPAKSTTPKNTTNRPVLDDGTPVNAAGLPPKTLPLAEEARDFVNNLKGHGASEADLDAARRELNGEVVKINPKDSEPFDHVKEVRQAQNGLVNRINALKRRLGYVDLPAAERPALAAALAETSKFLTYTEQWVPRVPMPKPVTAAPRPAPRQPEAEPAAGGGVGGRPVPGGPGGISGGGPARGFPPAFRPGGASAREAELW